MKRKPFTSQMELPDKPANHRAEWLVTDHVYLMNRLRQGATAKEVADELGRTFHSIMSKAYALLDAEVIAWRRRGRQEKRNQVLSGLLAAARGGGGNDPRRAYYGGDIQWVALRNLLLQLDKELANDQKHGTQ